jgi:hypothetical protein
MGVASFSVSKYARVRGNGAASVMSSNVRVSGAYATSTSATNLEDSTATDITLASGEVLQISADEAMRIRFGGVAATASTGHYIPAGAQVEFEVNDPGLVSIVDVA